MRSMYRAWLLGMSFSTLVVAAEPVKLESAFVPGDVEFVKKPGNSMVSGSAFLKLADGALKNCAGFNVELLPVAAYSRERILKTYGNDLHGQILMEQNPPKFTPDVPEYHELLIKSVCDAQGHFRFTEVPAGDYFIIAFIIWDDESGGDPRKTGGGVMKRIQVIPDNKLEVSLGN